MGKYDALLQDSTPKPGKYSALLEVPNPRDQVTFLGSENLGKIMADVFPRVAKGAVEGRGAGAQAGAGLLDAASLPGRGIASTGVALEGATWRDGNPELGKIKGERFAGKVLRDPGTGAALLAAPFTGGASIPALIASGAFTGAASATAHQGENLLEGRDFSPGQAAGEIALNALLPILAKGGGKVLKAGGKKILNTILKPKEGVQEQITKTGEKTIADLIFKHKLDSPIPFTGGVEGIQTRNSVLRAKANEEFGKILDEADRAVTLTSKAPPKAAPAGKTNIFTSGGVDDAIRMPPEQAARLGRADLLPESTIPGPEDVVAAGMNRPPLLTAGRPAVIIPPAPRPVANPPEVAITPNRVEMPNQIDPRLIQPRATSTPNQPPIPDAPPGAAYGIPSGRNLPALRSNATPPAALPPGVPLSGAAPLTPEEAALLGLPPGATGAPRRGFAQAEPFSQAQLGAPPTSSETTVDLTKKINLQEAIDNAFGKLGREFADEGKHAGVLPGIDQGKGYWEEALARKTGDGNVPIRFSQGFKQETGDAGNFLATDPGDVKGKARFANALYREIRDQQNEMMPELIPINKLLSETHPIKEGLADAIPRLEKNNLITPSDLWTLGPAAFGGGLGYQGGGVGAGAMAFAAPLLANRLSKNPTFASQLYRFGESMVDPGAFGVLRKRAIERALATARDENQ
jgi:hypothetical protein